MRFARPAFLALALACGGYGTAAPAAVLIEADGGALSVARAEAIGSGESRLVDAGAPSRYFDGSRPVDNMPSAASLPTRQFAVGVPEPGTWALILFGFAVVGAAVRRRKTTVPHFT